MKIITIDSKQSNTGNIHDLASDTRDREIKIPATAKYVIILAAYYGGRGYTTHAAEESAIRKAKSLAKDGYSYQMFSADGHAAEFDGYKIKIDRFAPPLA